MSYSGEKLISIDDDGAHILSERIMEKLEKKNISPSMITGLLEGCEVRWLADQFVINEIIEQEPDNPARRGSLFHQVMENFFALPKEERTKQKMKETVSSTLNSEEYADLANNRDAVLWLRGAVNGYYNMGGDPTNVDIAIVEKDGKPTSGIEIFVKGVLGESTRPILGFIDQLITDPTRDDGSVIVQDWKSGSKAKKYSSKKKSDDGLAEQRQQFIYAELLRQMGLKVSGARLIFPVAKEVVNVDLTDEDLRDRVYSSIEETDKKLTSIIESNVFEYKPSFLCAWCPMARGCKEATIKPYAKMLEAYEKQPSIDVLGTAVEFL